jgi:hypothetical protein
LASIRRLIARQRHRQTFDAARAAFNIAWQWLPPKFTEADFTEYRQHRAFDAWKRTMWDASLKLPTQVADGRSACFCGAEIADVEGHVPCPQSASGRIRKNRRPRLSWLHGLRFHGQLLPGAR